MVTLLEDELFDAQLIRAMAYAPYEGADVGECLEVAARIRATHLDLWQGAWLAMAERVRAQADDCMEKGDRVGARGAYLRASNYFRSAGVFDLAPGTLDRLRLTHGHERSCFRAAARLMESPPEIVEIDYEGASLPGYFHVAAGAPGRRAATLILTTGYDGTAEELYFTSGAAAVARGYNVLSFDGPGQGTMFIDRGVPFRPDWEAVVTPVVQWLLERPEVDPDRLVVMGLSFGGYLAPRAATREHRLAACISDCGPYDLYDATVRRLPAMLARQLPDGNPLALALLKRLLEFVMAKPTAGWALRRNLLVHGLEDTTEYFRIARAYTLKGRERDIRCPTLVCNADADDLSADAPQLYEALRCPKSYLRFSADDGAGRHCESGARLLFNQRIFSWLREVLVPAGHAPLGDARS